MNETTQADWENKEEKIRKNREKSNKSYRKRFYEKQVKTVDDYNENNHTNQYVPLRPKYGLVTWHMEVFKRFFS